MKTIEQINRAIALVRASGENLQAKGVLFALHWVADYAVSKDGGNPFGALIADLERTYREYGGTELDVFLAELAELPRLPPTA